MKYLVSLLLLLLFPLTAVAQWVKSEGGFQGKQISTPSNPASGYDRFYFKSDDKPYCLTAAGVEKALLRSGDETDPVAMAYLNQSVKTSASPSFTGAKIGQEQIYYAGAARVLHIFNATTTDGSTFIVAATGGNVIIIDYDPVGGTVGIWEATGDPLVELGWDNFTRYAYYSVGTGALNANLFVSTVATGQAPYQCSSETLNTHLNADLADGYHFNQSVKSDASPTFANLTDSGLTASKTVFTDANKKLTSTGIGTSSQFLKGDGSLDSASYLVDPISLNPAPANGAWSGIVITGTVGENVAIGNVLYKKSDGKYWKARANSTATILATHMATATITANNSGTLLQYGYIRYDSWSALTVGGWSGTLFLSPTTAGSWTQTVPSSSGYQVQVLGRAEASKVIFFNPQLRKVGIVEVP